MNVEIGQHGDWTMVRAEGEIDLSNVDRFEAALNEAVETSREGFLIDLSQTTYLDSAGIQAILSAYRRARSRGKMISIAAGNPNVQDLLGVIHLELLPGIAVCDDLPSAETALVAVQ